MAEVTGYARFGLNSRSKFCKACEKEFVVNIFVQTSVGGLEFQDMYDRMHTEKLKRIKKMVVQPLLIKCPYTGVCDGDLIEETEGTWKGYLKCSGCETLWEGKVF